MRNLFSKFTNLLILVFIVGGFPLLISSCDEEELPAPPTCTFSKDPDCFCRENPNNPLCNIANCTFELDPECYCENAPEDPLCKEACTFEENPECFCEENPNDDQCKTNVGGEDIESSGFYTFFDFEEEGLEVDSIFATGFTGDNPDGWQDKARAVGSIVDGDAPQGSRYFSAEIEVLSEGWNWSSNLFKTDTIDVSSLSQPTLNFWIRTSNEKRAVIEFALVDDTGESGWHPGGAYAEINGEWQQFSIDLAKLNELGEWKWGDGIDMTAISFLKFGFNSNNQTQGDIYEVHVDDIYIADGVPNGAFAYPVIEVVAGAKECIIFDFEDQPEITDIFETGFTGDNVEGWQDKGRAIASLGSGDAPDGDYYFINELEVLTDGWQWTSNLLSQDMVDLSAVAEPTFNFWVRTTAEEPVVMEFAISDDKGESGWHPGGPYPEINGEWQLLSINLQTLNDTGTWKWGDGINFATINKMKLGFNIARQPLGAIYEIHVDKVYYGDGTPEGAIVYPKEEPMEEPMENNSSTVGPAIDLSDFKFPEGSFAITDFEGAAGEEVFNSLDVLGSEKVDAFSELLDGGVSGNKFISIDITELDASQGYWSDFEFKDVNASFSAEDSVFINFVVRYSEESGQAMGMHPIIFDANHMGVPEWEIEEGGDDSGVNKFAKFFEIPPGDASEWRIISINLTQINDFGWGKWNVKATPDACCPDLSLIQHFQFALNLNPWIAEEGTSAVFDMDAMWFDNKMPANATLLKL